MSRFASAFALGLIVVVSGFATETSAQTSVDLSASRDNTLYSESGLLSNGAGANLFAGRVGPVGGGAIRRGLVAFDVAGTIPVGATIVNATLKMNMSKTNFSAGARTVTLHRLLADWGEGTSDATLNEGTGASATPGDATWSHRVFNTDVWTNPGGDFVATPSASTTVDNVGPYSWTSTTMRDEVQIWLDNPSSNFGWSIVGDEAVLTTAKRFDSRQNLVAGNRPILTVIYTEGGECLVVTTGDVNVSGSITSADIIVLVNFVFKGGPDPEPCPAAGDVNCSGGVTSADIITLVNFVFKGGAAPCDVCAIIPSEWTCP